MTAGKCFLETLAVGEFAAVPSKFKLLQISRQMLFTHMVESADDAALQKGVITLGKVGMEDDRAHERFAMVNCIMRGEVFFNAVIGAVFIGDNMRGAIDIWPHDRL